MATRNTYDKLYDNMKQRFTVMNGSDECTLGEFMLIKANQKKEDANLPVIQRSTATSSERAVAMLVAYVNDKLTIKEPPVKDKTIIAFPFRASASALLSAVACCALVLSIGIFGMGSMKENADGVSMVDYQIEDVVDSHTDLA
jgi:hypothetical protein